MLKNYTTGGPKWLPVTVQDQTGPMSHSCTLSDERVVKRHKDQLHARAITPSDPPLGSPIVSDEPVMPHEESVHESPQSHLCNPHAPGSPELSFCRSSQIR